MEKYEEKEEEEKILCKRNSYSLFVTSRAKLLNLASKKKYIRLFCTNIRLYQKIKLFEFEQKKGTF